ncbi:MAG TPA: TolC family protein [Thermotogota bacterium]|nr:TolC family protein [Thermotogota bacterium]HPJ89477.1 TolC family protein [Thermotogota bacterium]HPR96335.1 TolC family protein [Thermotogota bacterium]
MKKDSCKKGLRFSALIFCLLFVSASSVFSSELWDEYYSRLQEDSGYKKLQLQYKGAEQTADQYSDFFLPYFSLNMGGTTNGSGFTYSEIHKSDSSESEWNTSLGMSFSMDFLHVFGTDIGLAIPFEYKTTSEGDSEITLNHFGLTMSRKLITEEYATELGNQASLLSVVYDIEQYEWSMLIQLVKDVFNQIYYETLIDMSERKVQIYTKKLENELDEDNKDQYLQQKLLAEKSVLTSQKILNNMTLFDSNTLNTLYNEILLCVPELFNEYSENNYIIESKDIKALKLEVQKAFEEKELWYLPYIFNPNLNFQLNYYFDEVTSLDNKGNSYVAYNSGDWTWSIGVSGSLDIMDRGERDLDSLNRQENYTIKQMELEDSLDSKEKTLEQYAMDIEISDIDLTLKQLEMEQAIEDAEEAVKLYQSGYMTAEDKELELMTRDQTKLDYLQVLHELYTTELELMKESGIILGGYTHEEEN